MQQSVVSVSVGAGGAAASLMYPVNLSAAKEEELEECLEELLRREAFLFRSTFDSRIFPLTEPTWISFSRISRTRYFFISYSRESPPIPPLLLLAISSISRDSCLPPPLLLLLFKYFWFEILKIKVRGAKKWQRISAGKECGEASGRNAKFLSRNKHLLEGRNVLSSFAERERDSLLFKGLLDSYVLIRRKWRKDEIRNHAER